VIFKARWLCRAGTPLNLRMLKFRLSECTACRGDDDSEHGQASSSEEACAPGSLLTFHFDAAIERAAAFVVVRRNRAPRANSRGSQPLARQEMGLLKNSRDGRRSYLRFRTLRSDARVILTTEMTHRSRRYATDNNHPYTPSHP